MAAEEEGLGNGALVTDGQAVGRLLILEKKAVRSVNPAVEVVNDGKPPRPAVQFEVARPAGFDDKPAAAAVLIRVQVDSIRNRE